jgi:AcrR family transcriptional regulator
MEAGLKAERKLDSDKAQRILEAMRSSVGRRGAAGSTFDHVAQEAGVSRGLLHYYFGSKERLLVEVLRRDGEMRLARLDASLGGAGSVDELVQALVSQLEELVGEDPGSRSLIYEMASEARRNPEIRDELAAHFQRVRERVADVLRAKERDGVVRLRGDAEAVASILFALADGLELQLVADPAWDSAETLESGMRAVRFLLGAAVEEPA